MGGLGSGPQVGSERALVENCLVLDINWLYRAVCGDGQARTISWENRGRDVASVSCKLYEGRLCLLMLTTDKSGGHGGLDFQEVEIISTACNYGGVRHWFVCPGCIKELEAMGVSNYLGRDAHCGRRVSKLYLPPGGRLFLCRHCYDLRYMSQRASVDVRMARKSIAIRRQLGQKDFRQPFPPKPKGMHQRTYERLMYKYRELNTAAVPLTLKRFDLLG